MGGEVFSPGIPHSDKRYYVEHKYETGREEFAWDSVPSKSVDEIRKKLQGTPV